MLKDISEIKMDAKIEEILNKYKQIWPYKPLDFLKDSKKDVRVKFQSIFKKRFGGEDS